MFRRVLVPHVRDGGYVAAWVMIAGAGRDSVPSRRTTASCSARLCSGADEEKYTVLYVHVCLAGPSPRASTRHRGRAERCDCIEAL